MENKIKFRKFGTMIDCSRNAVMSVKAVKKWIDVTSDLGYNCLMLYTEDTYEMDGHPYFGYLRGRYSKAEMKEIDAYATAHGIEMIPCIQTLAHLNSIKRWSPYTPLFDIDDILLTGDERVYALIDDMFKTLSECFKSRIINIGMDEAHKVGRGKYYDTYGDRDRTELLVNHVAKVAEIGKKYGYTVTIWSDMFYRLATGGDYYKPAHCCDENLKKLIPDNIELVYWDYYHKNKEHYDEMLKSHFEICDNTWFAGVLHGGHAGFGAHNVISMQMTESALKSCIDCGVKDVFLTLWGDDGAEGARFATLPALFHASELAKGNSDMDKIKEKFTKKYGISFDEFLSVDMLDSPLDPGVRNPDKYLLFNDLFVGVFDTALSGTENRDFKKCAEKFEPLKDHGEWGYFFGPLYALCEVLSIKSNLGQKTRAVYRSGDKKQVESLIDEYDLLLEKLEVFYKLFRKQWIKENKPHGFEIHDIRLGGLIKRTEDCRDWLISFKNGEISVIEELEEQLLDAFGRGETPEPGVRFSFNRWDENVSVNVISHYLMRIK